MKPRQTANSKIGVGNVIKKILVENAVRKTTQKRHKGKFVSDGLRSMQALPAGWSQIVTK